MNKGVRESNKEPKGCKQYCENVPLAQNKLKTSKNHHQQHGNSSNVKQNYRGTEIESSIGFQRDKSNHKSFTRDVSDFKKPTVCDGKTIVDLSSPSLCSALQLANKIQATSIETQKPKTFFLKNVSKQQAKKKANVPFTEQIFKDLVDLQITDEDITSRKNVPSKSKDFGKHKDKVFELLDHYKADFSLEYCAQIQNKKVEVEKVQYYEGGEIYERIESIQNVM